MGQVRSIGGVLVLASALIGCGVLPPPSDSAGGSDDGHSGSGKTSGDSGGDVSGSGASGVGSSSGGGAIGCDEPAGEDAVPYEHADESVHALSTVLDITGHFGVAMAGGHLLASDASGGSGFPRTTPVSSSGTLDIPAGATVRYALLWYTGAIFLKPGDGAGQGDYTTDVGGKLDALADVQANGITLSIDGAPAGPFDTGQRLAPGASELGSESQISPVVYSPHFGTWTGVKESVWGNRLDVTGLFTKAGPTTVEVHPPERLDINGNDATHNGGNPAGSTNYNLCSGGASWSLMVIFEKADLPQKNLVLYDGGWARAWDYLFFHSGNWQRPKIRIDHAPIQPGARIRMYAGSSSPAGSGLATSPTCSCGCGGQYTLTHSGLGLPNSYFSYSYSDPAAAASDPMHRDKTNGPWYVAAGGLSSPISGNDWTLFQSGARYTEFPNLFEGEEAPTADGQQPMTNEDDPDASHDAYAGHPWAGRGAVTYHGHGNACSVVEIAPDCSRLSIGEKTSYVYLKGDQKDVWKPQQIVSVKWLLFETPVP